MSAAVQELCGLFGKLPQQADFVRLHLDEGFTERWHAWLQTSLSVSREQLGDEWLERYLTSPAWRFALSPGAAAEQGVVGVLIPSVDEVGRYYPLTVAHCGDHDVWGAYLGGDDWFDAVEQVAVAALGEDTGYMRLIEWLEALPLPQLAPLPRFHTVPPRGSVSARAWALAAPEAEGRNAVLAGLMDTAYRRWLGSYSLFWTAGSQCVEPSLLLSTDLPGAGQFAAMLDGDWRSWGWAVEQRADKGEPGSA